MKHTFRGALTAWLALIALRTVANSGTGPITSAFADLDRLVSHALSPNVPAIPDRRKTGSGGATGPAGPITPQQAQDGYRAGLTATAVDGLTGSGGLLNNLDTLGQYANGGSLAGIENNPALQPGYLPGNP